MVEVPDYINNIVIEPADLETYAQWQQGGGKKVLMKNDVFWFESIKGFFQPLHFLQKLEVSQIKSPELIRWGLRGALKDQDSCYANGSIDYFSLDSLKTIEFSNFSKHMRRKIKNCFKYIEIKEVLDKSILETQGYDVLKSSLERTRHRAVPEKNQYSNNCSFGINNGDNSHMVLGGFLDDRLLGYVEMCAVQETVYIITMMLSKDALKYDVSAGLYYTVFMLCKQSKNVLDLYAGQPLPEKESLGVYKHRMGMSIKQAPTLCKVSKLVGIYLQKRCPGKYRRLVGNPVPKH